MSATVVSYAYVGFQVHESDFWNLVPDLKETCSKGHEQRSQDLYCPIDGTRFEKRHGRVESPKFVALAHHYQWHPEAPGLHSWLKGYERIYANLLDDDDDDGVRLYTIDRMTPVHGTPLLALAKMVSCIKGYQPDDPRKIEALDLGQLDREFELLDRARKIAGFETPVQLFLSLYRG